MSESGLGRAKTRGPFWNIEFLSQFRTRAANSISAGARALLPRALRGSYCLDRTFAIEQLAGIDDAQVIEQRLGAHALRAQADVAVGPYVHDLGLFDPK
jgi:hypothetical protein